MRSNGNLVEFLEAISSGRHGVPVSIDEAQAISGLDRAAVLDRFRRLQAGGEGYLKLGRHGHPTRFYFRSPSAPHQPPSTEKAPLQVAKLGPLLKLDVAEARTSNQPSSVPSQTDSAEKALEAESTTSLIEHQFQLRASLQVSIRLPADLTEREAGRLAKFIETIPF